MSAADMEITWINTGIAEQVQLFPDNTIDDAVVGLIDLGTPASFGSLEFTPFTDPRVHMDGLAFYGGVFSAAREIVLPLWCRCGSAAAALDMINQIDQWFSYRAFTDGYLTVERKDGSGGTATSTICAFLKSRQAFTNNPAGGPGIVGDLEVGNLLYVATLVCPYPHFRRSPGTPETGQWTGSEVEKTLTNNGSCEVGLKVELTAPTDITSVTVLNSTTGRYATITDPLTGGVVIDWYMTSPFDLSAIKAGTTSVMSKLNPGAKLTVVPGENVIKINGVGDKVDYSLSFAEAYDSV